MRVVFAPDSFKGTVEASEVAAALARGWRSVRPGDELVERPMADGGEGTLDAFAAAVPGARRMSVTVTGPDDRPVNASWIALPDGTAVVELAATSGLTLLDPLRPHDAHSRGFGEAIAAALDAGASRLLLGLGGSSSTDGGTGALSALGARFADASGRPVAPGNRGLASLAVIDLSGLRALPARGALVLGDVTNPLLGPLGAAAFFGPQKGATPADVAELELALAHLVEVAGETQAVAGAAALAEAPGAGAAGGAGFGLLLWGAEMGAGSSLVASAIGLADDIAGAEAVAVPDDSAGAGALAVADDIAVPDDIAVAVAVAVAVADGIAGAGAGTGTATTVIGTVAGTARAARTALVVTGEGRYDGQSEAGKAPSEVARLARRAGVPVALVAGAITAEVAGFEASIALIDLAGDASAAMADGRRWLERAGAVLAARAGELMADRHEGEEPARHG